MGRPSADFEFNAAFEVNSAKPLDTRTVVDYYTDLSNLTYAYEGLLVYVKNDTEVSSATYSAGYYFYDGTNWSKFETGGEPKPYELPIITSFTATNTGDVEGETRVSSTLQLTVTKGSADIVTIKFYKNNSVINTITENVAQGGVFTYTATNISTDSTLYAIVTDSNGCTAKSDSKSINFVHYIYVEPKTNSSMAAPTTSSQIKDIPLKYPCSESVDIDRQALQYGAYVCCKDGYKPNIRTNYSDNLTFSRESSIIAYEVEENKYLPYNVWETLSAVTNISTYDSIQFEDDTSYSTPKLNVVYSDSGISSNNRGYTVTIIDGEGTQDNIYLGPRAGSCNLSFVSGSNNTFKFTWQNYLDAVGNTYDIKMLYQDYFGVICRNNFLESKQIKSNPLHFIQFVFSNEDIRSASDIEEFVTNSKASVKVTFFSSPFYCSGIRAFSSLRFEGGYVYAKVKSPSAVSVGYNIRFTIRVNGSSSTQTIGGSRVSSKTDNTGVETIYSGIIPSSITTWFTLTEINF